MSDKRLFLLDAMALVYRAYYALMNSPRMTSKGKNTNAQFGFTNTLYELIKKEAPTHMAVVWDTHAATERHKDFEDYKANRQAAPEDLLAAIPDIKRIVKGFNIPCLELDGYEADDIIGTIAWEAAEKGYKVFMVTPDKDYGQLVKENVVMYKPAYKGNSFEILGVKEILEKWNIQRIDQVIDLLGLMGDASDNIPGIPGVGEKTAVKLLAEYDNIENILENADSIKGKLGEKIRDGREKAILSKKLATIITNVPIDFVEEDTLMSEWNRKELEEVFAELEFRALTKRILETESTEKPIAFQSNVIQGNLFDQEADKDLTVSSLLESTDLFTELKNYSTIADTPHDYHLIEGEEAIQHFLQQALKHQEIAIDTETTSLDAMNAQIIGMSFSWKAHEAFYIHFPEEDDKIRQQLNILSPLFDSKDIRWIGQNIKYDLIVLKNYDIELAGDYFDTMLAHYVIAPDGKKGMDLLSQQYLKYQPVSIESLIGKRGKNQGNMRDVPVEIIKEYAAEDADITFQLKQSFQPLLKKEEVSDLFYDIENPLAKVLAGMEYEGVGLDKEFLEKYAQELDAEMKAAESKTFELAGVQFNLASPKQLGEVLFDKLQLDDKAKKTRTGQYATGEDVLQKLKQKHPIIEEILNYRTLSKLKSTYADALPSLVNPKTHRLHTSFNQAVVSSGRLSSNNPNLQNIPIRTTRGKEIRKAFVAVNDDYLLLSADYSQIELRVVAALSGDENMIRAFNDKKDIHRATAAKIYGVEEEEVNSDMRRNAKAVNFGIIYGQSAFGLSENLGISRGEAKIIIDNYFVQYHSIKKYMDDSIAFAKEHGYVKTLKGRKISLPDINSSNNTIRSFAERVAINAPVQGTAADMIKLAMINIDKVLKEGNYQSKMILQVHDELVFDVHKDELDAVKKMIISEMENALPLPHQVPVVAEAGTGHNWLDAH